MLLIIDPEQIGPRRGLVADAKHLTELSSLEGFDIKLVKINGLYKLIAPYSKDDFKKAQAQYKEKEVWPVVYKQQLLVDVDY